MRPFAPQAELRSLAPQAEGRRSLAPQAELRSLEPQAEGRSLEPQAAETVLVVQDAKRSSDMISFFLRWGCALCFSRLGTVCAPKDGEGISFMLSLILIANQYREDS